jgi:serine/threonine protein kinase
MTTDIMHICHGRAFDEMDGEMETSTSYEDFCQPIKCALNEEPSNARCISIDSDLSINLPSSYIVRDGYSDILDDYDIYPTILGTGNYGCVRECLHRSTSEIYAVKTIEKSKVTRRDHIQREIQLLRSIDHPGIMKLVDCYEDVDYVHIVTERYNGGELFDKIVDNTTDSGCLPEDQAAKIIKSLLEAVQYLHSKDIVHRDIKPENVLFESNEEGSSVKLIDFGLSRTHRLNEGAMANQVGTPYYMSPGVLRGKYDRSCDLWAIGIVSYILLCGYPPFNGSSDYEVHESVLRGKLVFEEVVWGKLSNAARDFVSKLLCDDSSKIVSVEEALRHPWVISA